MNIDQSVPDFSAPATGGDVFQLSAERGHPLVIYFYPKDDTPGCTTESAGFRDAHAEFAALGCRVVGVSRDGMASHERFKAKLALPFELISDEGESVCNAFGVIRMKNMYGKQVRGIERSTFLIDSDGVLRREWRGVKVPGHVDEVLAAVRTLVRS